MDCFLSWKTVSIFGKIEKTWTYEKHTHIKRDYKNINQLSTHVALIEKPVNWFAQHLIPGLGVQFKHEHQDFSQVFFMLFGIPKIV